MTFFLDIQQNLSSSLLLWSYFLLSIIISYFYQKTRVKHINNITQSQSVRTMNIFSQTVWILLIIIGPALAIGFRHHNVGADTLNYWVGYLSIGNTHSFVDAFETLGINRPVFFIFQYIIFKISNGNPTAFLIAMSVSTLFILVKALDKWILKISLPLALFVYYSIFGMQLLNQSRQLIALSIFLLATMYLIDKKKLKFIILIVIASLVHYSALIALILPLILNYRGSFGKLKKWIYYSLLLLSPFILYPILNFISNIIPSSYSVYFNNLTLNEIGLGLLLNILPIIIPIILFKKHLKEISSRFLVRVSLLVIPMRLAGYYSYYLMRMYYYAAIFIILLIPIIVRNIHSRSEKIVTLLFLICVCLVYYIVNFMIVNSDVMFPYISIFSD